MDGGAEDALHKAIQALVDGPGDPRSVEGVKANALQSIAWSLIGILARQSKAEAQPDEAVSHLLERAELLRTS